MQWHVWRLAKNSFFFFFFPVASPQKFPKASFECDVIDDVALC